MKPAPFDYHRARSVDDAVALMAGYGDEAKVMAGGQSLMALLNLRLASPAVIIDLSGVAELRTDSALDGGGRRWGSGVTHADVEDARVVDPTGGLARAAATGIGYRAIRNRGTVGGSLAHADPAAEWPMVLAAVGAIAVARSTAGERRIPVRALCVGFYSTVLGDEELLTSVEIPAPTPGRHWGFVKFARKTGEFAQSMAAVTATVDDATVGSAEIWLGSAADVPLALPVAARAAAGSWDDARRRTVREAVVADLDTAGVRLDDYTRHLHSVIVTRALDQLVARA